jgi:hypothetical protein
MVAWVVVCEKERKKPRKNKQFLLQIPLRMFRQNLFSVIKCLGIKIRPVSNMRPCRL